MDAEKKKRGRPTKNTQVLKDAFCNLLVEGVDGKPLSARQACAAIGLSFSTLWSWLSNDEEFSKQYARAKELQAEAFVDSIIEISDESPALVIDDEGAARIDNAFVQHQKMRIDARKWLASKLIPKKYGEKITQEHTGKDGQPLNPPTQVQMTDEQLSRVMKKLAEDV